MPLTTSAAANSSMLCIAGTLDAPLWLQRSAMSSMLPTVGAPSSTPQPYAAPSAAGLRLWRIPSRYSTQQTMVVATNVQQLRAQPTCRGHRKMCTLSICSMQWTVAAAASAQCLGVLGIAAAATGGLELTRSSTHWTAADASALPLPFASTLLGVQFHLVMLSICSCIECARAVSIGVLLCVRRLGLVSLMLNC